MKYRKKPVVIEAFRPFIDESPDWWADAIDAGNVRQWERDTKTGAIVAQIYTLEGQMDVIHGDWVIQGVQGELYPCKPDIFEATYEEA